MKLINILVEVCLGVPDHMNDTVYMKYLHAQESIYTQWKYSPTKDLHKH